MDGGQWRLVEAKKDGKKAMIGGMADGMLRIDMIVDVRDKTGRSIDGLTD